MLIHGATDNDIHPPLFGASQRSFGLYRGLARRHRVRVLCVVPNRSRAPREEIAEGVTLVRRSAWYTSAAWRLEQAGIAPFFLAAHGHRANAARFLAALPGRPDVLAADLNLAGLLPAGGARLRVHTSHNVEHDHFRMVKSDVAAAGFWARRIRRLEADAVTSADLTVVCSEEDAARMGELYGVPGGRLVVIPNGFDESRVRPASGSDRAAARATLGFGERDYVALFLGSDTRFNRAGARLLVDTVFPAIAPSGFRLLVVGGVARALAGRREPWLSAHDETDRIQPFLDAADAGLNPVATGGGSNVKVPTYLGAGLAVVTTEFGVRGYAPLRGWVVVAEPERTAEALRERPQGWSSRGLARPPAIDAYAWGRLGEQLGTVLEERLSGCDAAPARAGAPGAAANEAAESGVSRARGAGGGRT